MHFKCIEAQSLFESRAPRTTDGLKTDADGSITIYIQHENPGTDKQSNWLPAPAGGFNPGCGHRPVRRRRCKALRNNSLLADGDAGPARR